MFAEVESADTAAALAGLHAGRAALNSLPLHTLTDADLLAILREQEADARRSAVTSHAVIAELEARGTAREHGCASTATLLVQVLRINPNDASGRVRDAANLGPRRGLTGEVLPPIFAQVAAAQATGASRPAMPGSSPRPSPRCPRRSGPSTRTCSKSRWWSRPTR